MFCEIKYDVFYPEPATSLEQALARLNLAEHREPDYNSIGAKLASLKGIQGLPRTPVFIQSSYSSDEEDEDEGEFFDDLSTVATVGSNDEEQFGDEIPEESSLYSVLRDLDTLYEVKDIPLQYDEYQETMTRIRDFISSAKNCMQRDACTRRQKSEIKGQIHAVRLHMKNKDVLED